MSALPQSSYEPNASGKAAGTATPSSNWLGIVKQQVETLKFGAVTVTIHEGRVVQVETSSKIRFDRAS